jgi:energy-coupling factor transport system permease protein
LLLLGVALAAGGLVVGGRRATRSRYRPDPWNAPEWLAALSGATAATTVLAIASSGMSDALNPAPTGLPGLPLAAALGVLVAILPAWLTPAPPRTRVASARTSRPDTSPVQDPALTGGAV